MRLVLDTNRYCDFWNALPQAVQVIDDADDIYLPFIVVGELRGGFLHGSRARENERALQAFLNQEGVEVLWPDDATTRHYGQIYRQLRQQGTLIPTNDIWIAALVVQHGLTLYARDKHFDHLPQLMRI
jgi:tRNA(fMet)-specific endonuclease VapC